MPNTLPIENLSDWKGIMTDSTNASLMVTERAFSLYLTYELSFSSAHLVNISPAEFISDVLTQERAICKNEGCPKLVPNLRISKEYQHVHLNEIDIIFLQLDNLNSCAFLYSLCCEGPESFQKDLACVQCCLHKALAHMVGENYGECELTVPEPDDRIDSVYFISRWLEGGNRKIKKHLFAYSTSPWGLLFYSFPSSLPSFLNLIYSHPIPNVSLLSSSLYSSKTRKLPRPSRGPFPKTSPLLS